MKNDFDIFLGRERAKHSSKHSLTSLIAEVLVACFTVTVIWRMFPHGPLLAWLAATIIVSAFSFWTQKILTPEKPYYTPTRWRWTITSISTLTGFAWGMLPVLFFAEDNITYLVLIVALYTGYISGAQAVTFTFQPSFIGFTLGITIPFAGRMFYQGGELYNAIGGLSIFYIVMLIYVSKNTNKLFLESARAEYEHTLPVKDLAREKVATEKAMAAKDRFLASASHDLRQPLNAISLFVDALRPLQTKELGNEIVDKIRQSLKGLNGMLHSLLDISRLDADVVENLPRHISLNTLVSQLCDEYRGKAPHLDINCHIEQETIVLADPTILYRIVRNLIDNAVKYTPQGQINIHAQALGQYRLHLSVQDTGVGIPADKITTIFDEFEQLNNPERNREKGLGLGLAIVKRLCKIAGINIKVESTVGEGTIATLKLSTGSRHASLHEPMISNIDLNGKLALVVDDEPDILIGMRHLLSGWGCKVITCESLAQALEELSDQPRRPDFIISDLRLRGNEQGTDVIDAIRHEYNKDIPAVIVTGDTAPDRVANMQDSGLTVIYKPMEPDELKTQLGLLLKQY